MSALSRPRRSSRWPQGGAVGEGAAIRDSRSGTFYFTLRPLKKPAFVVFCLIFAVSPCSSVFCVWSFLCDVSFAASAFCGTPLLLRFAGGIGGIRPVICFSFTTFKRSTLDPNTAPHENLFHFRPLVGWNVVGRREFAAGRELPTSDAPGRAIVRPRQLNVCSNVLRHPESRSGHRRRHRFVLARARRQARSTVRSTSQRWLRPADVRDRRGRLRR